MTDREAMKMALDVLERASDAGYSIECEDAIEALRQALAQPDNTSDSATRSADSAESFCKQELHNLMSVAGRMALELECLLLDTENLSVVSKWWDTGMEALQAYRHYVWSVTHGKDGENFCDTHCVHTDHHPDCKLAQPEQDDDAYEYAKRLAECIWEKYYKEESPHWIPCHDVLGVLTQIDNMTCGLEKAQPEQEPVAWLVSDAQGRYATIRDPAPYGEEVYEPLYAAPPKPEQWTPVEIGVDVTPEGAHVVGMYVLMPQAVRHVFYSQFHPAPKREWVGLTVDEILDCYEEHLDRTMFLHRVKSIEAKIKEKNT